MENSKYWQAVLSRDKRHDGKFVFAVRSTGIYCRPSCPARHPKVEHVRFFALPADAEREGFRACKRCQPDKPVPEEARLEMIRRICQYVGEASDHTVTLDELGKHFNLSPHHLGRRIARHVRPEPPPAPCGSGTRAACPWDHLRSSAVGLARGSACVSLRSGGRQH